MNLFKDLPAEGVLFPYLSRVRAADRATEFGQRCRQLGITGVSLHSYRYAWAERAKTVGYPERFAQEALGHNSKAVHRAYAKRALMKIPSLEDFELRAGKAGRKKRRRKRQQQFEPRPNSVMNSYPNAASMIMEPIAHFLDWLIQEQGIYSLHGLRVAVAAADRVDSEGRLLAKTRAAVPHNRGDESRAAPLPAKLPPPVSRKDDPPTDNDQQSFAA